jgi:N-acetylneuraminic acid mutarotase
MLRLRSWLPAVVLALVGTQAASAHFLWLLTGAEKAPNKVQVFFGEDAGPDDPALLDKVAKAEVWAVGGRGGPGGRGGLTAVTLTKGEEALEAELTGSARGATLILKHTYGVLSKGGAEPFLLMYYGKTHPSALPGTWRAVNDDERLPLEITPTLNGSSTLLQVTWKGKPVAGSTVTVVGPGIEKKLEGTTDETGNFRCELPKAGTFSIRAKHTEETAGKLDDKEYKSVRHYSTLTLHYVPSRLTPTAHNLPALPKGTTSFGGAIVGDSLFVFGGNYGSAHEYNNEEQSGDLWTLDLKSPAKWEQISIGPKLQGLAMVEHKGLLYRVGGFTAKNKDGDKQDLHSQAEFARLQPGRQTWDLLPSLPEGRSSHDAAVVGDTLYVVGGWNMAGSGHTKWHDSALSMNLASDKLEWKTIAAPPFKRRALALAAHQGKLFCLGGMQEQGGPTTAVAIYDPQANAWSEGPALLGNSMDGFGCSAFACNGSLFATTMSGSIQRLSDDGKQWEFLGQLAHPRFFHRLLPWNNSKLVVVGGASMTSGKIEALELLSISDIKTVAK